MVHFLRTAVNNILLVETLWDKQWYSEYWSTPYNVPGTGIRYYVLEDLKE